MTKINKLTLTALFAALTAVASQIAFSIPFTPIPVNLALLPVFLAGSLLGAYYGALSQVVYLLLGLAGAPVFAHLSGGAGTLFGHTGGYIAGYVFAAFICGLPKNLGRENVFFISAAMVLGLLACYLSGTLWFVFITQKSFIYAINACIIPFVPGDALKITAGVVVSRKLPLSLGRAAKNSPAKIPADKTH